MVVVIIFYGLGFTSIGADPNSEAGNALFFSVLGHLGVGSVDLGSVDPGSRGGGPGPPNSV